MFLETKRIFLRKPILADFDRFWDMINDPIAKEFTGGVTKLSYKERLALFEEESAMEFSPQGVEFAVINKTSSHYIGYCGFRYSASLCGCEFLFGYCRDSWGVGYATEAANTVVRFLFQNYPHTEYIATVDPQNKGSIKVLEKTGFIKDRLIQLNKTETAVKYLLQKTLP